MCSLFLALLAFAGLAVADDPDKPDEPPIRLKKKTRPPKGDGGIENPEGPGKDDKSKEPKDGQAKKDDAKKNTGQKAARGEDERKKLVKRVLKNLRDAEGRLAKHDPGKTTRKIQKEILDDLDALIRQTRQQPPPQRNQRRQQRNQRDNKNNKNNRNNKNNSRSNRNDPKDLKQQTEKSTQPNRGNPNRGNTGGSASGKRNDKNADLHKDAWGHLTEKDRQRIDEYTRAGNIPEYESLQQEYERTLAEEGSSKKGD
jgi:hypothetical protein